MARARQLSERDYARLLAVRTKLRRFERWSAEQATAHGLTASQHQLLLAIRGHDEPQGPTIGQIADYLLIRHHSAVELIDRSENAGLLTRERDRQDQRAVRLRLAPKALRTLEALSNAHIQELASLTPMFESMIGDLAAR
jgi:DNA-binding MarR family transcriptional regulator